MPEATTKYTTVPKMRQRQPDLTDGEWRVGMYDRALDDFGSLMRAVRKPYRAELAADLLAEQLADADTQHRVDILTGIVKALGGDKAEPTTEQIYFERLMEALL